MDTCTTAHPPPPQPTSILAPPHPLSTTFPKILIRPIADSPSPPSLPPVISPPDQSSPIIAPTLRTRIWEQRDTRLDSLSVSSLLEVRLLPSLRLFATPVLTLRFTGTPYAKKPLYRSRKCKILCPILGLITLIVSPPSSLSFNGFVWIRERNADTTRKVTILLTVFPIIRAIATHTLSVSVLHVYASNITNPTNNSFGLTLEGQVKKAGIFPARIAFTEPVKVYWIAPEALDTEIELGNLVLAPLGVAAGHGRIKQLTRFNITDAAGFARFTEYLITQEAFTWRLKSSNVQAKAFGFIPASNLNFVKVRLVAFFPFLPSRTSK